MIPSKYTCDGANVSPQISWENIPEGTKSLALICDDPDAPMGTFVHWVLYDIPPMIKELPENILPEKYCLVELNMESMIFVNMAMEVLVRRVALIDIILSSMH